jgi:high-affinity iron transporter
MLASGTASITAQLTGSALLGLREGLETGIVVMVLIAFLVKADRRKSIPWAWAGVGCAAAMVVAIFLAIHLGTSTVTGTSAELIAGIASLVAVVIVTWMVLWMRVASRSISGELKSGMARAVELGPFAVLSLAFLAVGREGVETALLMVGYAENAAGSMYPLLGLLLGIAAAAVLTVALYHGALRIDLALFFRISGAFLIVVAAGILAYGIRALQTSGVLPGATSTAFDISEYFSLSSWYGALLQGVLNLRPDPTVLQVVAWSVYLVVLLTLFLRPVHPVAVSASP